MSCPLPEVYQRISLPLRFTLSGTFGTGSTPSEALELFPPTSRFWAEISKAMRLSSRVESRCVCALQGSLHRASLCNILMGQTLAFTLLRFGHYRRRPQGPAVKLGTKDPDTFEAPSMTSSSLLVFEKDIAYHFLLQTRSRSHFDGTFAVFKTALTYKPKKSPRIAPDRKYREPRVTIFFTEKSFRFSRDCHHPIAGGSSFLL
jgi:hypothetical protein